MLKVISYWSVRDGLAGTRPVEEAMDEAKAVGFDGIELAIAETGVFTTQTDQATCEKFRKAAEKRGLAIQTVCTGMSWGCCPTDLNPDTRKRAIQLNKDALQRVAWLGSQAYLFVPGAVKIPWVPNYGPVRYDHAVAWAKEGIAQLAEVAEKVNVDLCVENVWNGLFYSPLEFAALLDSFKSPRVGMYFDVGNLMGLHQDPAHWIEILGKRIRRVHIKDFKTAIGNLSACCDLLAGDVPWARVMAALRAIGYDKTIVAEMMPYDDALLARTKVALDKIFTM